jgi:hypothetical protein
MAYIMPTPCEETRIYLFIRQCAASTLDFNPAVDMEDTLQVFPYAWQQQDVVVICHHTNSSGMPRA